jgi:hypothetical protein
MSNLTRQFVTLVAALTVSVGIVAMSAPAQADTSWGYSNAPAETN